MRVSAATTIRWLTDCYLDEWNKRHSGRNTNFWKASHPVYTSDQTDMPEAYSLDRVRRSTFRVGDYARNPVLSSRRFQQFAPSFSFHVA